MISSDIIAIIAIIISLITVGITIYFQFFYKKEDVQVIITNTKVEGNIISTQAVFCNLGNRFTFIANTYLQIDYDKDINLFSSSNHERSLEWNSFILNPYEQKDIILNYILPPLDDLDINDVSLRINTCYINSKGDNILDNYCFGKLCPFKGIGTMTNTIKHKLSGYKCLSTIQ